jgi:hypothetical protein
VIRFGETLRDKTRLDSLFSPAAMVRTRLSLRGGDGEM